MVEVTKQSWRILLVLALAQLPLFLILSFCFWVNYGCNGAVSYETDFSRPTGKISNLFPLNRVATAFAADKIKAPLLLSDPVYFRLKTPATFSRVNFSVRFMPGESRYLELGAAVDEAVTVVESRPLYFKLIEDLKRDSTWMSVSNGQGLTLFQKKPTFETVEQFFYSDINLSKLAVYNAKLPAFKITKAKNQLADLKWQTPLLGEHRLAVLAGENRPLNFEFQFSAGTTGEIYLFDQAGQRLKVKPITESFERFMASDLEPAVYFLNIKLSPDQKILAIDGGGSRWGFDRQIRFADLERPTEFAVLGAGDYYFQAFNETDAQKILIDDSVLTVAERNRQYFWRNDDLSLKQITGQAADLKLNSTDLLFPAGMEPFAALGKNLKHFRDIEELKNLDYVLVDYTSPLPLGGGIYLAQVSLSPAGYYVDEKQRQKYLFSFYTEEGRENPRLLGLKADLSGAKSCRERLLEK